jgi:predicted dehydrogenase
MYKVNQKNSIADGTSLKGYIETTYNNLVNLFGIPKEGSSDGKTTCEWIIEFQDGTVATIHDWKTKTTPKDIYKWSIGGHTYRALDLVQEVINIKPQPLVY